MFSKFYQLNDFLDNLNKNPAEYLYMNEPIRAKLVPIDPFIPKLSTHLRSKIGKFKILLKCLTTCQTVVD